MFLRLRLWHKHFSVRGTRFLAEGAAVLVRQVFGVQCPLKPFQSDLPLPEAKSGGWKLGVWVVSMLGRSFSGCWGRFGGLGRFFGPKNWWSREVWVCRWAICLFGLLGGLFWKSRNHSFFDTFQFEEPAKVVTVSCLPFDLSLLQKSFWIETS